MVSGKWEMAITATNEIQTFLLETSRMVSEGGVPKAGEKESSWTLVVDEVEKGAGCVSVSREEFRG